MNQKSLYERLGGFDAITAVVNQFLPKVLNDSKLRRFFEHRGINGLEREKQLLILFLSHTSGGDVFYPGRSMEVTHQGMKIDTEDYDKLVNYLSETLDEFNVASDEHHELISFIDSLRPEIIET